MNDQSSMKGHGHEEKYQRCEFCNVPIFRNPCSDERSGGVFKGKGKMLCNKCAATLAKMPAEQALQALDNAFETYSKE
jgi:Zn-finger protein